MKSIIQCFCMFFLPAFKFGVTANSVQFGNGVAQPPVLNDANIHNGKMRFFGFSYTQSGAGVAGDDVRAIQLPAGKVRLVLPMSRVAFSAFGASRTMDIGWEEYTNTDGTVVAADPNGLDDGVSIASAGSVNPSGTVGGDETFLFDSQEGVVVTLQVNDGTLPDGATLDGYFAAVVE